MHVPSCEVAAHEALELRRIAMEKAAAVDLRDQLLRMLRIELVKMKSSASATAHRLSIHRRTLNSAVKHRMEFRTLADAVRFAVARVAAMFLVTSLRSRVRSSVRRVSPSILK